MNYNQFLEICKEVYSTFEGDGTLELEYYKKYGRFDNSIKDNPRLKVYWETGGYSGGDCWGGEAEAYCSDEPAKDLQILDKILEKICPAISFVKYKDLYNSLVKSDSFSESEYYGNSTDFDTKEIYLLELYNYLVVNKFIECNE